MKRIIILILALAPILIFAQGAPKLEIDWIPLEKAKKYAKKYDKNILIYFYKKDCPYCDEMNKETLNDITVVNLINNNFFPVDQIIPFSNNYVLLCNFFTDNNIVAAEGCSSK